MTTRHEIEALGLHDPLIRSAIWRVYAGGQSTPFTPTGSEDNGSKAHGLGDGRWPDYIQRQRTNKPYRWYDYYIQRQRTNKPDQKFASAQDKWVNVLQDLVALMYARNKQQEESLIGYANRYGSLAVQNPKPLTTSADVEEVTIEW